MEKAPDENCFSCIFTHDTTLPPCYDQLRLSDHDPSWDEDLRHAHAPLGKGTEDTRDGRTSKTPKILYAVRRMET